MTRERGGLRCESAFWKIKINRAQQNGKRQSDDQKQENKMEAEEVSAEELVSQT